jgi:endopolyphosphatase
LASESRRPKFKLEYLTFPLGLLHPERGSSEEFHYPVPLRNLPRSLRNVTGTTSKYAPYALPDLTIASWIGLAKRLASPEEHRLRKKFKRYMHGDVK